MEKDLFKPGEPVNHRIFGNGTVLVVRQLVGTDDRVQVDFETEGKKCLVVRYAALRRGHFESQPQFPAEETRIRIDAEESGGHMAVADTAEAGIERQPPSEPESRRHFLKSLSGLLVAVPGLAKAVSSKKASGRPLKILETRIAGYAYYEGERCLTNIRPGDQLELRRQPRNRYDMQAIEVYWDGQKVGYVPRMNNAALSKLMDKGEVVQARVSCVDKRQNWEPVGFDVEVWV